MPIYSDFLYGNGLYGIPGTATLGSGGRTVTFNAQYKHAWSDTGNTLDKRSTVVFSFNGTNWEQIGAQSPYI